jgi:hypothetical protein
VRSSSRAAARQSDAVFVHAAQSLLADISHFSNLVLKTPLRRYQIEPLRAILSSVMDADGREFLLVFPRQSGKNEAVAQLLAYLLNLYARTGGNIVYGAESNSLGLGVERLERHLDNVWNAGAWQRGSKPPRRSLRRAQVVFLSTHPSAQARGQTAHRLLVIDETQDQDQAHIEAVFTPMRASTNAPALYIGTVKLTTDFLWQKKLQLERQQAEDGLRRVFVVQPETVVEQNPRYRDFLDAQVRTHGRDHPIVASEYFLEPIDGTGGLFPARRRALMLGAHRRQRQPEPGALYVATLDVAGEDEAATDPIARLAHPGRDYTVATIFRVEYAAAGSLVPGPTYRAVDVFVDRGSRHFQESPGQPALVHRLLAFLQHWGVAHLVSDESGVGLGLTSWLRKALGEKRVTGFSFSGPGVKAALGSAFLSLVETGRFKYWPIDRHLGDAFWFWAQVEACTYEVPPEGRFDRDLRWGVHPNHRTSTPEGPEPTHDDRLLSAALIAHLDRELAAGRLLLGSAVSAVVAPADPLAGLEF